MNKPVVWVASSKKEVRAFPDDARARAGYEVYRVQVGLEPTDWKPMSSVGDGACEIRIHSGREHRVIYVAKFSEAVYVLHAFEKKSRKTSRLDLDTARRRYRQMVVRRSERRKQARKR